ncbi:MAG: type II secretion system F family protein [Phycisphaerae bacterium]
MPTFTYKARNATGEQVVGTLVAETSAAAARMLDERALLPVQVDELRLSQQSFLTGGTRRIGASKVGVIYEQLADLLRAGVPMLRSLDVLSKQTTHVGLARVLREVHDEVAGGDALADAMSKHPHAFPELHVSMVRAGEKGGFVEDVLTRLSDFITRQDELRNKLVGALIYPCVLMVGLLGAVSFLMVFVVPRIRQIIPDTDLPTASQIVFFTSDLIRDRFLTLGGVLLVIIVAVVGFFQSTAGKRLWARLQLELPVFGKVYTMVALCRFCRIFGTLLAAGIPILQALRIAKDSAGNLILAESIDKASENVRGGQTLAGPLAASKLFPPSIVNMIAVAEESNTLEKVLVEIANTQEARTARQIDLAVRLLEPLLLFVMAVVVGFIALALMLPILQMSAQGLKR